MAFAEETGSTAPSSREPISRFVSSVTRHAIRVVPALEPFREMAETIARFAGVGAASSILYAIVIILAVSGLHLNHDIAALLGFAVAAPFNFLMHRYFTFRSAAPVRGDLARYATMQGLNVILSIGVMALSVDGFHLPYAFGILGAIVLIPVVTYVVMDKWVFRWKAI